MIVKVTLRIGYDLCKCSYLTSIFEGIPLNIPELLQMSEKRDTLPKFYKNVFPSVKLSKYVLNLTKDAEKERTFFKFTEGLLTRS